MIERSNEEVQAPKEVDPRKGNVRKFLGIYPAMLPYYIVDPKKRKLPTAHLDSPDTRCCTLVTLIFVLLFTCLSIFLRRNINEQYFV